ncbi:hypothetical protein [Halotia branconii]|uniref:Uncharacterized protein n=1 Tax=Halotia branconii CENA392 TaxID=1539056 RepID=A0AAJ6NYX5_9CYAN|nr:hypothetical protein [Halotia branconii]WGV29212.1 hypothetical protein QI031_30900 [Halotia branconii CENA392]
MIKFLIRLLPDSILELVNAFSLAELDKRKLIIWAEDVPTIEPEVEYLAFNLASHFTELTSENMPEILKIIAEIYTKYGDCLAFTYLMEISAEYFGLIEEAENV